MNRLMQSSGTKRLAGLVLLPLLLPTSGCLMRVGPKTIRGDRFDYSASISNSYKTQMMMNLVKFRYMDSPVFLDIAQVVATYTYDVSASVNTPDWASGVYYPGASASGRWAESPTITYNPMAGDKFTKSLLAPVSPVSLFQLVQAGWPLDAVFAVAVRSMNGLHAVSSMRMTQRPPDPHFYEVLRLLRELQLTNTFSIRVQAPQEGESEAPTVQFGRRDPDEANLAKAREVRRMLGLNPEETEFKIAFGSVQTSDKEIAVLTRSILEIIGEASAGVEIPDSDIKDGRAIQVSAGERLGPFTVKVRSSSSKPASNDAFIAAQYHGHWFWIDDRDLTSKRALAFLMLLATLAESGSSISPPVLTISKP
ncbi:MAG: hypothetical protein LC114_24005 [Bryobacterales bacterium]|nr:hypothetical protein [Bryobacterales bacterium]